MLKIAICDDSLVDRELLTRIIKVIMTNKCVECSIESFESGEKMLEANKSSRFNLVFLDIFMNKMNGIEIGKLIREKDKDMEIVYCSSSKEYLLTSYELFAMGYLLKPYEVAKLTNTIDFYLYKHGIISDQYLTVISNFVEKKIFFRDIEYVESMDKIIIIYTKTNDEIKVYDKLSNIEEKLNTANFFRCHQSFIVNFDYVEHIDECEFITVNNKVVPIRRKEKREIIDKYEAYIKNDGVTRVAAVQ